MRWVVIGFLTASCTTMRPLNDAQTDRDALFSADRDFDANTAARGIEGWLPSFEETTTLWQKELVHGRENYRAGLGKWLAQPGHSLRWQPAWAEAEGNMGYTTGRWQMHQTDAEGKDIVAGTGHYVTIWRRQRSGGWKAVFDMETTRSSSAATAPRRLSECRQTRRPRWSSGPSDSSSRTRSPPGRKASVAYRPWCRRCRSLA